ncbi:MAG: insulinase family protein [Fibrobacter sp.]|nr:insulinase family protein [Fibrobacter sp.]
MRKVYPLVCSVMALGAIFAACSSAPTPKAETSLAVESADSSNLANPLQTEAAMAGGSAGVAMETAASDIPASYKDIKYPEFKYVAPYPKDFRVEIAPGISGYIVSDRSLPLVSFTVYFEEPRAVSALKDEAASEMVGSMLRRGGGGGISAHALDDSLEFISASLSTSAGTFTSMFDIDCLTKDFPAMMELARSVLTQPNFDKEQLEILKANFVTAYEQRYDTPAKILSALRSKVNYEGTNPRLWDASLEEYKKVSPEDVKRLAEGVYSGKRIVFALSGDVDKDSAIVTLKKFFEGWKVAPPKSEPIKPTPLTFLRKPGTYVVDKNITQANISMNQPFVRRPHEDYYPAAVASFILGGGSFSSRLMNSVRTEAGLAYSIYSTVGNDYRDTAMVTIALQTKVETVDSAMKIIYREIDKLAAEGPTEEELALAKKSLIESLPSLFDSPASTALIFAKGELLGKTDDHYLDYVKEINAVTAEQVKAMIAKYFDKSKMTISIVGPVAKFENLKPFTVVPLDSLEFR